MTVKPITQGQIRRIANLGADAIAKVIEEELVELNHDGAQNIIGRGNEFASAIRDATLPALQNLSVSDRFKDEEVKSNYGYLSGYKPKGLNEQCNRLRVLFPGIGFCKQDLLVRIEKGEVGLPKHAEGWFAIPNWMKNPDIFGATYSEALQKVVNTIKQTRNDKFYNYREGQLDEKHVRQSARTRKSWQELSEAQGNPDILIVAAQFGIHHRGRSVRRACEVFLENEFGLGAFAIGMMILTHPERLQHYDDLWGDCAGDESTPNAVSGFSREFYFGFGDGRVEFDTDWIDGAYSHSGSASGFLSQ